MNNITTSYVSHYLLEDPAPLHEEMNKDMLHKIFDALAKKYPGQVSSFDITATSSWIIYNIDSELTSKEIQVPYLLTETMARNKAKEFIDGIFRMQRMKWYLEKKLPQILPGEDARVDYLETLAVPDDNNESIAQWLCRYQVSLKGLKEITKTNVIDAFQSLSNEESDTLTDEEPTETVVDETSPHDDTFNKVADGYTKTTTSYLSVLGSLIEVRLNMMGQIIAFSSRWRPMKSAFKKEVLNKYVAPPEDDHHHDEKEEEPVVALVYQLDGEDSFHNTINPYYMTIHGHHSSFQPASGSSFSINITIDNIAAHTKLTAFCDGGSGNFSYSWYGFNMEELDDLDTIVFSPLKNSVTINNSSNNKDYIISEISFLSGTHQIRLYVRDNISGIIRQKQYTAYGSLNTNVTGNEKIPVLEEEPPKDQPPPKPPNA